LKRFANVMLVPAIFFLAGFGETGKKVTAEEFGKSWPFTVESGEVACVKGRAAIFRSNGEEYQLNGIARSLGYKSIDPIWKDNPEIPGTKKSTGEMIRLALDQC